MKFKVSEDKNFLLLQDSTNLEFEQLESSLTKLVDNWFIIKKKMPYWDGKIKFIDKYNRVPFGLWGEIKNVAKEYKFPLKIDGINEIFEKNYNEQDFYKWVEGYFKDADIQPRDYQIEGAKNTLFFKRCTEEISTSGGKTLIAFMIFKYLFDKGIIKKMLYVVPNLSLITQTEEKFYEYEDKCNKRPNWKSLCIHGGSKKKYDYEPNIIFGTYQSLTKKKIEFFKEFDGVTVDECLHPDTLITMADFSKKKIKYVKNGELVWTYNEETNEYEVKKIDFVYKNLSKNKQMYEIEMEDGNVIYITENHKVLTNNKIWKRVDELEINDNIIDIKNG